jgi:hypothetical protein
VHCDRIPRIPRQTKGPRAAVRSKLVGPKASAAKNASRRQGGLDGTSDGCV